MIEASYSIKFISNIGRIGYGHVVLETGTIKGGDSSFIFDGTYQYTNGKVTANVLCKNTHKTLESIFGDSDEFNLKLQGNTPEDYKSFTLKGYMIENAEMKIDIEFTRESELP